MRLITTRDFGRTMEWDTAAGHAVLAAAGGSVATETGEPLTYGKTAAGYANPGFVASAEDRDWQLLNPFEAHV